MIFYTVGLPGAGKTTFARSLSQWLGSVHLRGDAIGLELFRFPTFSPAERQAVYGEMSRRAAEQLRAGRHVVYDAAVNTRTQRQQLAVLARQNGGRAVGVWVQVPPALAKQRAGRLRKDIPGGPVARIIPPALFDQYAANFEIPSGEPGIIVVAGNAHFALQYRRLQRQLGRAVQTGPRLVQ